MPLLLGDFEEEPPVRATRFIDESFLGGFLFDPAGVDGDIDGMVAEFFMPVLGVSASLKILSDDNAVVGLNGVSSGVHSPDDGKGLLFHPATSFSDILLRARNVGDKLLDQRLVLVGGPNDSKRIFLVGRPGVPTRSCLSEVCDVVSGLNGENTFSQKDLDGDIMHASQAMMVV